jgi:hypothetical protein
MIYETTDYKLLNSPVAIICVKKGRSTSIQKIKINDKKVFITTKLTIIGYSGTVFQNLAPNVVVSSVTIRVRN